MRPLDSLSGALVSEAPDDGDGLGGGESAVDGGGVDAVGVADQLLAGVRVLALPEAERLVAVHLAGEAEGAGFLAEPLPGPFPILLSSREGAHFCWPPVPTLTWPLAYRGAPDPLSGIGRVWGMLSFPIA